jgi:hypothetical protein
LKVRRESVASFVERFGTLIHERDSTMYRRSGRDGLKARGREDWVWDRHSGALGFFRRDLGTQLLEEGSMHDEDVPFNFYKSEHRILLARIDSDILETRQIERYVVMAAACVYTWLATASNAAPINADWAWWIPFGLTGLGVVRCLAILARINAVVDYVKLIERRFAKAQGLPGWRSYFDQHRRGKVTVAVCLSWFLLLMATLATPILITRS